MMTPLAVPPREPDIGKLIREWSQEEYTRNRRDVEDELLRRLRGTDEPNGTFSDEPKGRF